MSVLIYKILLGFLVIATIMAMLDRSLMVFVEENLQFVQLQHEAFVNKKELNASISNLRANPIQEQDDVRPSMSNNKEIVLNSVASARPLNELDITETDSFCRATKNAISKQEDKCKKLSNYNCKQVDCCILLNGAKCVSGGADGPNFYQNDGNTDKNKIGDDYYYYHKDKCYGKGCNV